MQGDVCNAQCACCEDRPPNNESPILLLGRIGVTQNLNCNCRAPHGYRVVEDTHAANNHRIDQMCQRALGIKPQSRTSDDGKRNVQQP